MAKPPKSESLEPKQNVKRLAMCRSKGSLSSLSRPVSSISRATVSSLGSCKSTFQFSKAKKASCPGDFCNYELASHFKHRQKDVDMEDLVTSRAD
jgi:hypothetical protein